MQRLFFMLAILVSPFSLGNAGILASDIWTPSNCGERPTVPVIADKNADAFNQSVKVINEWQKKVNDYNACVVKEANLDNDRIAKAANAEQAKFNQEIEKMKNDIAAAKNKLDKP
ncbi:MAG: hypothetical protein ABL903_02505 [Methylococcales bacterium]